VDASGSLEALREHNRRRVVDALRRLGTASRSDLARETGLSRTTIATLVGDLQSRGLIAEQAPAGIAGRGRPAGLLRLDSSAGAAVGIHFDHRSVRVAVADLSSTVLAEQTLSLDVDHDASTALDAAADLVDAVLAEAGVERSLVIGVGAALAGPIDHDGTVGPTVIMPSWLGLNAADELSHRIGFAATVDNDANLGALAELTFGAGRGFSDAVYVMVSSGIGGAVLVAGRLHRGATGYAGELGHVYTHDGGPVCRCGNRGCLETVASTDAILGLLRPAHGDDLDVAGLTRLLEDGDLGARRVVGDAGREIGRVLAGVCNVLSPAGVIVGGDLAAVGDPLLAGIREALERYALPTVVSGLEVKAGVLGERAELLGALAMVIGDTERLQAAGLTGAAALAGS
jgi:predicted NBD/HSP70 family sugar kinase